MSAVTTPEEPLAVGRTGDGHIVICNAADPDVELIAALRDAFDRNDPVPPDAIPAGRLDDLRGSARIPRYGAFVRELLDADRHETSREDTP